MSKVSKKMTRIYSRLEKILLPFKTLVIIGSYWGDEGKGKIIDLVAPFYDAVARFSGGAGAGHTLITELLRKFIGHLIPCGVAHKIMCFLARGEFFDLARFIAEKADAFRAMDGKLPPIRIDRQSPLWTPWHPIYESYIEYVMGKKKVRTTGKAIGILSGFAKLRISLLVGHLFMDEKDLRALLRILYKVCKPNFDQMIEEGIIRKRDVPGPDKVAKYLLKMAPEIKDDVIDTSWALSNLWKRGKRILLEGAQAIGLDPQWGTYPYVTSGNCTAAGAALGTGLPPEATTNIMAVFKILPTRVGAGPFPSEVWDRDKAERWAEKHPELFEEGRTRNRFLEKKLAKINAGTATPAELCQYFMVLGDERGATTGRGRSIGLPDLQWLRYMIRINKPKFLALTRFDMLSGVRSIQVVTGYKLDGRRLKPDEMPEPWRLGEVEVITQTWRCWSEDISGCDSFDELPEGAQRFIKRLEKALGVPIVLVGTGAERDAVIVHPTA
ncbi:adenylosuccinate synthetase [Patescibacteria group bacterium]|nr:adenylosuccinate synthetase [Patescibacteria group bacterium]